MEFIPVNETDNKLIKELSQIATEIVKDFYDPILGEEQNDYMLKKFQSEQAITEQIHQGYRYYIIKDNTPLGFIGFYKRGEALYLSKFYLYKTARGKGYGRKTLSFIIDIAKKQNLNGIELNVNKYNPTVAIYEKLGFIRIADEKNSIGNGYYMDDYVYRLEL